MPSTKHEIGTVLQILNTTYPTIPMHEVHALNPFRLLVAIILSQRARDSVTVPLTTELFKHITSPQDLVALPLETLEHIIRPIGFYHAKSKALKELATQLCEKYDANVPSTELELLSLPHVGRKTSNIILTTFFHTPQIAVDIHVHRITNRLGWVQTKTALETEKELTRIVPKQYHEIVNRVFVMHGQHICLPRKPKCSICPIYAYCQRKNVQISE